MNGWLLFIEWFNFDVVEILWKVKVYNEMMVVFVYVYVFFLKMLFYFLNEVNLWYNKERYELDNFYVWFYEIFN